VHDPALEALIDDLRHIHNPGDDGVLAPGEWCIADGEEWPCRTMRTIAAHADPARAVCRDETTTTAEEAK
jgi:hypothetical protein